MKCDSRLHSWPTPLQALTLVVNPRLGLQHIGFETHGVSRLCFKFVEDSYAIDEDMQQYLAHIKIRLHDAEGKFLVANYKKQKVAHSISKVENQIENCNHLIYVARKKMATFYKELKETTNEEEMENV